MMDASLHIAIVVIAASFIGFAVTVDADDTLTGLVLRICNGKTYSSWSDHSFMPDVMTDKIASLLPDDPTFDVYDSIVYVKYTLYGHGFCSKYIDRDQCITCMKSAKEQMFSECSSQGAGAQIELQGCKLRYEEYYFGPPK